MDTQESKMLQSISEELGVPNLLKILSSTPMRRLQAILVHAFKNRAFEKKPSDLLREYESKHEFYGTSSMSQSALYDFARVCHKAVATTFEAIQTSPIAPLGLNSVLSKISQNNVLSTIRGSEVVSDLTTQLALECAFRRKQNMSADADASIVHLCTAGRVLRLQPFDTSKGYMQHYNLFALCSGGANSSVAGGFAVPMLLVHISGLLDALDALRSLGHSSHDVVVNISDMRFLDQLITAQHLPREEILRNSLNDDFDAIQQYHVDFPREVPGGAALSPTMFTKLGLEDHSKYFSHIEKKIMAVIRERRSDVRFCFDFARKAGLGYYPHLCFHIFARNRAGMRVQLADGGAVDWSAKLLGDSREAMVTSGIGAELIQKLFD